MQKYIYVILHKFSVWELKTIDSQQEAQYNREMQLCDAGRQSTMFWTTTVASPSRRK